MTSKRPFHAHLRCMTHSSSALYDRSSPLLDEEKGAFGLWILWFMISATFTISMSALHFPFLCMHALLSFSYLFRICILPLRSFEPLMIDFDAEFSTYVLLCRRPFRRCGWPEPTANTIFGFPHLEDPLSMLAPCSIFYFHLPNPCQHHLAIDVASNPLVQHHPVPHHSYRRPSGAAHTLI